MRKYRLLAWLGLIVLVNAAAPAWSLDFPKFGHHVDLVGALGGSVKTLETTGTVAYLGEGSNLSTVDISDRTNPKLQGRIYCGGTIDRIRLSGSWAYLNVATVGLAIMDISDPKKPVLAGFYAPPEEITDFDLSDNHAFLVSGGRMQILDVQDPRKPKLLVVYGDPTLFREIAIKGRYAYLIGRAPLTVLDITNFDAIHPLNNPGPPNSSEGGLNWITVSGSLLFVGMMPSNFFEFPTGGGVSIYDISKSATPTLLKVVSGSRESGKAVVSNGRAYVCGGESQTLTVLDVSDLTQITVLKQYSPQAGCSDVKVASDDPDCVFLANADFGLDIVDQITSTTPRLRGRYLTLGQNIARVKTAGPRAYVAEGLYGLRVVDINNPAQPALLGHYSSYQNLIGFAGLAVHGNAAYLASSPGDWILDVSDPTSPSLRGRFLAQATDVAAAGTTLAATSYERGMDLFTLDDPTSPTFVKNIPRASLSTAYPRDVIIAGSTTYVMDVNANLKIFDIANPAAPQLKGTMNYNKPYYGNYFLKVDDGKVCIPGLSNDDRGGIRLVDVSTPSMPNVISTLPDHAIGLDLANEWIYALNANDGLKIMDTTSLGTNPIRGVFKTETPWAYNSSFGDVTVEGSNIYVANNAGGMLILRYTGPATPAQDDALIEKIEMPTLVEPGLPIQINVTVRNIGWETWGRDSRGSYSLTINRTLPDAWKPSPGVTLPAGATVAPGATYTFTIVGVAPSEIGCYPLSFQMLWNDGDHYLMYHEFGQERSASTIVWVAPPISAVSPKSWMGYR